MFLALASYKDLLKLLEYNKLHHQTQSRAGRLGSSGEKKGAKSFTLLSRPEG